MRVHIRPTLASSACWLMLVGAMAGCESDSRSVSTAADARHLLAQGRIEEALEGYGALVRGNPDDFDLQLEYGTALARAGSPSRAIFPLSRALESPDHAVRAGMTLATLQIHVQDGSDALATLDRVLELDPANLSAQRLRAEALLVEKREEEALELLDRLISAAPKDTELALMRFRTLLSLERIDDAAETMAKLRELTANEKDVPPATVAQICLGNAVFAKERGESELAESLFAECLSASKDALRYTDLVKHASRFYDERGQPERATAIWRDAHERDRSDLVARINYAYRLRALDRKDEAYALVQAAAPSEPRTWLALVDMYVEDERFADAAAAMRRAIELHPEPNEAWIFSLADYQILAGDPAGARETARRLERPVFRLFIEGRLLFVERRYQAAHAKLLEAVRLWPDNPDYRHLAGLAAERAGNYEAAVDQYKEAARGDPPPRDVTLAFARLMIAHNEHSMARVALERLRDAYPADAEIAMTVVRASAGRKGEDGETAALRMLAGIPGQAGAAVAEAVRLSALRDGPDAALDVVEGTKVTLASPESLPVLEALSKVLADAGRYDEALTRIDAVLARPTADSRTRVLRAEILARAGRLEEARVEAARARSDGETGKEDAFVLVRSSRIARILGDAAEALRWARSANALAPLAVDATIELARAEAATGSADAALALLDGALDEHPHDPDLIVAYAEQLLERPGVDATELARIGRRAALFADDQAGALVHARCLLATGKPKAALPALVRARRLHGDQTARAAYFEGVAHESLGENEEALQAYGAALTSGTFPERTEAVSRRQRLERAPG